MGFWAGANEGLTYVLDKKAEKESEERNRTFLKETRDEERRYTESQNGIRYLQERTLATLPLLVEKREQEKAIAAQQAQIGSYFKGRTADLPEEARDAFTNLVLQDSTYSTALMETVQATETKLGRALTGNDILKLTDIFERTKPEDVAPADWIKQAAGMTVTSGSSINFDETVEKLFSGEMTLAEVEQVQMELLTPSGTSLGIVPDFATFELLGIEPETQKSLMSVAKEKISNRFAEDLVSVQEEIDALNKAGGKLDPKGELATRFETLSRIENETNSDRQDSMLMRYYAPTVLPQLAADDARYTKVYPEFFQPSADNRPTPVAQPEKVYEILGDEDFNKLPSGAKFRGPDGIVRRKP
jgi:hypothetical protein